MCGVGRFCSDLALSSLSMNCRLRGAKRWLCLSMHAPRWVGRVVLHRSSSLTWLYISSVTDWPYATWCTQLFLTSLASFIWNSAHLLTFFLSHSSTPESSFSKTLQSHSLLPYTQCIFCAVVFVLCPQYALCYSFTSSFSIYIHMFLYTMTQ